MKTLNAYFGRELLRGFAMTAVTLTMLVVMGGGVTQVFMAQGISASDVFSIFMLFIPIALVLMLPVAALFGSTITYGRGAADNEILACQAAGINIHRLLGPPAALGLLVTVLWLWGLNFFIPSMLWNIEDISRRDIPAIVAGRFLRGKPLNYGGYTISAKKCREVPAESLGDDFKEGYVFLHLLGVSFMEMSNERVVRVGTADKTIIQFDNTERRPKITVDLQKGRSFDAHRNQYFEFDHQVIGPLEFPMPIKRKIRFENLWSLLEFHDNQFNIPEIQDLMHGMHKELKVYFLAHGIEDSLQDNKGDVIFYDDETKTRIKLSARQYDISQDDGRVTLKDVEAMVWEGDDTIGKKYLANLARIRLDTSGLNPEEPKIAIELEDNVRVSAGNDADSGRVIRKPNESLPSVRFSDQPTIYKDYKDFVDTKIDTILDPNYESRPDGLGLYAKQKRVHQRLIKKAAEYRSEVEGEIHFRISISIAWLPIVLIGALLGIIIRSGQVLIAFFISCIPCLFIIVTSLTARNLADRPDYGMVGIGLLWSSTAILYLATWVIATKFLRR